MDQWFLVNLVLKPHAERCAAFGGSCPPSACVKPCALATRPVTPIVQVPALIGVADAAKDDLADILADGLAAGTSEAARRERCGILISSLLWSQPVIEFASSGARD